MSYNLRTMESVITLSIHLVSIRKAAQSQEHWTKCQGIRTQAPGLRCTEPFHVAT